MKFDWYQAGVEASPQVIIDTLASCYELADVLPTKPFNGYERAYMVKRGKRNYSKSNGG